MKRWILAFLLLASPVWATDFTKANVAVLDWTALGDTVSDAPFATTGVGELTTVTDDLEVVLHIDVAHVDVNTNTTGVIVAIYVRIGSTDEFWSLFHQYPASTTTAVTEALDAESAAAQTQVKVAATTDWDTGKNELLFLWDNGTLADSCLVTVAGWSDADYYTADHNLVNTYAIGDDLFDDVSSVSIQLPSSVSAYKVNFYNQDDDANFAVRVNASKVTDIE